MPPPTPAEPDWTALPGDPRGFFELPADFDRIELRRKYSALVRRFKPEKYPGEFQRIRAAFEDLDQQLRDSQRQTQRPWPVFRVHYPCDANRSDTQQPLTPTDAGPPEGPTRRSIVARRLETPEQLAQSLRGLANRLRNDSFYAEAWPLWEELTAVETFERWQPLLAELSRIVDIDDYTHPPVEKVEFFIRFLRRALWMASDDWREDAFDFLEDNADLVRDPWEYEVLLRLDDYRDDRNAFLDGSRGRQIIDNAIVDYCMKPETEALEAFRIHQMELAAHSEWLREAFPFANDDMSSHWPLWSWLGHEAAERLRLSRTTSTVNSESWQDLMLQSVDSFRDSREHHSIQRAELTNDVATHFGNLLGSFLIGGFGFICSIPVVFLLMESFKAETIGLLTGLGIGFAVFLRALRRGAAVIRSNALQTVAITDDRRGERALTRACYEKHIAPRIEGFARRTGVSFEQLLELSWNEILSTSMTLKVGLPMVQMIHQAMSVDYALACMTVAFRFARPRSLPPNTVDQTKP